MNQNKFRISVLLVFLLFSGNLLAKQWYEDKEYKRYDPFKLVHSPVRVIAYEKIDGKPHRGLVYAILSADKVKQIEQSGNKLVQRSKTLSENEASLMKKYFSKKKDIEVPYIVNVAAFFTGAGLIGGTVQGGLLVFDGVTKYFVDKPKISGQTFAELMSKGGKFIHYYSITKDKQSHPYIHSTVFYNVQVGGEDRNYKIYTSTHALKIESQE